MGDGGSGGDGGGGGDGSGVGAVCKAIPGPPHQTVAWV